MTDKMNPLETIKMLRSESLSAKDYGFMVCVVLRTDNKTLQVRCSEQMLAQDAGLTEKTVRENFKRLDKYFSSEKAGRQRNYSWVTGNAIPVMVTGNSQSDTGKTDPNTGNSDLDTGKTEPNTGNGYRPSTLSSTNPLTSSSGDSDEAPSEATGESQDFSSKERSDEDESVGRSKDGERLLPLKGGEVYTEGEKLYERFKTLYVGSDRKRYKHKWEPNKNFWCQIAKTLDTDTGLAVIDYYFTLGNIHKDPDEFLKRWQNFYEGMLKSRQEREERAALYEKTRKQTEAYRAKQAARKAQRAIETPDSVGVANDPQRK